MDTQAEDLFRLLVRRAGGESRADAVLSNLAAELGLTPSPDDRVLAAVALVSKGMSLDAISSQVTWNEFEEFCAHLLRVSGYVVKRNIVITKPRRQIDIYAKSSDLGLCVDCKHWSKSFGGYQLEKVAMDQIERASLYKRKMDITAPILPVILTMVAAPTKLARGVPVVPIFALRDFLASVSRFEDGFSMV
jgi:Restriction endonuclease